jgi:hypothetical protein
LSTLLEAEMDDISACECSDPGCPEHKGDSECIHPGLSVLYRIDMLDYTGTLFCEKCGQDAIGSGLFTVGEGE